MHGAIDPRTLREPDTPNGEANILNPTVNSPRNPRTPIVRPLIITIITGMFPAAFSRIMTTSAWEPNSYDSARTPLADAGAPGVRVANPNGPLELVMVVDDDDFIRHFAVRVLTGEGYRVATAPDGYEATDMLRKLGATVELVILDFVMPAMDGAQVLRRLRQVVPNLPAIVTSGFGTNTALRDLLAGGACGFIPKPLARKKLLLNVRATIDEFKGTL